jgi:hypothetical protein
MLAADRKLSAEPDVHWVMQPSTSTTLLSKRTSAARAAGALTAGLLGLVTPCGWSTAAAAAGHPSLPVTGTARTTPSTVVVDETTRGVTVRPGTLVSVRLHGTPTSRWDAPETATPRLLQRLSASATPDGNATGTFRAVAAGEATILAQRGATCSSGPASGVCGAEARRIRVTVTGS